MWSEHFADSILVCVWFEHFAESILVCVWFEHFAESVVVCVWFEHFAETILVCVWFEHFAESVLVCVWFEHFAACILSPTSSSWTVDNIIICVPSSRDWVAVWCAQKLGFHPDNPELRDWSPRFACQSWCGSKSRSASLTCLNYPREFNPRLPSSPPSTHTHTHTHTHSLFLPLQAWTHKDVLKWLRRLICHVINFFLCDIFGI